MRHDQNERQEEDWGDARAARLAWDTIWLSSHAVVHDPVPILSCRNRKEQLEAHVEVSKVLPFIDDDSFFDVGKETVAKYSTDEKDEHQ